MYPAVLLMYFISAAVILLASFTLIVQVSLPYNNTGRASVLYNRENIGVRISGIGHEVVALSDVVQKRNRGVLL